MKKNHRTLVSLACAASMILTTVLPSSTVYAENTELTTDQNEQEQEAAPSEESSSPTSSDSANEAEPAATEQEAGNGATQETLPTDAAAESSSGSAAEVSASNNASSETSAAKEDTAAQASDSESTSTKTISDESEESSTTEESSVEKSEENTTEGASEASTEVSTDDAAIEEASDEETTSEESSDEESRSEEASTEASTAEEASGEESAAEETTSEEASTEETTEEDASTEETTEEASTEDLTEDATTDETAEEAATEETTIEEADLPTMEELDEDLQKKEDDLEVVDETVTLTGVAKCDDEVIESYDSFSLDNGTLKDMAPSIEGYEFTGEIKLNGTDVTRIYEEEQETTKEQEFDILSDDGETSTTVTKEVVTEKKKVTKAETSDGVLTLTEDGTVTFYYEETEKAQTYALTASYVDEDGSLISSDYENLEISFDGETAAAADVFPEKLGVEEDGSDKKVTSYTYKKAYVKDGDSKVTITDLKRTESDDGVTYQVKKEGESEFTDLTSDTTLYVEYSDGEKTTYTYSDVNITVTATLESADAIPDDARFSVTPITNSTDGYNYDAYMDALNSTDDETTYSDDNTLLYDIAFLGYGVDEDGNIDTSKTIEYQPTEGSVKIEIRFKKNQLSDSLGAEEDADVTVTHLPLKGDAANSSTTKDAENISADDINVESVDANVDVSNETTSFDTDSFSVYAFQNSEGESVLTVYNDGVSAESVLGDAWYYGITSNSWKFDGESETNFAVKTLYANGGQTGLTADKVKGSDSGASMLGTLSGSGVTIKGLPEVITCPEETASKIHHESGSSYLKFTYEDASTIASKIDDMISHVASESTTLADKNSVSDYSVHAESDSSGSSNVWLDLRSAGSGTIYIDADKFMIDRPNNGGTFSLAYAFSQSGKVTIYKRPDQVLVLNFLGTGARTICNYYIANTTSTEDDPAAQITDNLNGTSTNIVPSRSAAAVAATTFRHSILTLGSRKLR